LNFKKLFFSLSHVYAGCLYRNRILKNEENEKNESNEGNEGNEKAIRRIECE
jgi:hypothetical protein